jgi:glutathione peroxidase-family protein
MFFLRLRSDSGLNLTNVEKIQFLKSLDTFSVCFGCFLFVSVQSKQRKSLFRYLTETTKTNVLFRIVSKIVSVPVSVVSNRN